MILEVIEIGQNLKETIMGFFSGVVLVTFFYFLFKSN